MRTSIGMPRGHDAVVACRTIRTSPSTFSQLARCFARPLPPLTNETTLFGRRPPGRICNRTARPSATRRMGTPTARGKREREGDLSCGWEPRPPPPFAGPPAISLAFPGFKADLHAGGSEGCKENMCTNQARAWRGRALLLHTAGLDNQRCPASKVMKELLS